jgi:hypothetical protein
MSTNLSSHRKTAFLVLVAAAALAAIAIVMLSAGSDSGGAETSANPSESFSVLESPSAEAKAALPDKAQEWLASMETNSLPGLKGEELIALGSASTQNGEVVVADLGQNVCAYSVELAVSTCGGVNLINEGKLLAVKPGCKSDIVIGVLPDGVTEVRVETEAETAASGDTPVVPVTSNVYTAELEPVETVLTGTSDSGESFKVPIPLGKLPSNCQ